VSSPKTGREVLAILVNYNTGPMLREAVDSLLRGSFRPDVVVVDNASTDRSIDALKDDRKYRDGVELIVNEDNLGFAKANNQILRTRKAKYYLLMNPDCALNVDTVEEFVRHMDANPDIGLAGGTLKNPDGSIQKTSKRKFPTPLTGLARSLGVHRFNVSQRRLPDFDLAREAPGDNAIEQVEAISGALMFVRGSLLSRVGLLDEGFFMHCEDLDWCKRFWDAGSKVAYIPSAIALHHKGGSGRSPAVVWHLHRGMIRFYRKHYHRQYPLPVSLLVYAGIELRCLLLLAYSVVSRNR
jgi:hypothetical protein